MVCGLAALLLLEGRLLGSSGDVMAHDSHGVCLRLRQRERERERKCVCVCV